MNILKYILMKHEKIHAQFACICRSTDSTHNPARRLGKTKKSAQSKNRHKSSKKAICHLNTR